MLSLKALSIGRSGLGVHFSYRRSVIAYVVDRDIVAIDSCIGERYVHGAVGLDLLTIIHEGNVDSRIVLKGLALVGHGLFDSFLHGGVSHTLGDNLSALGNNAGFGSYLHRDAANLSGALKSLGLSSLSFGSFGFLGFGLFLNGGGFGHLLFGLLGDRLLLGSGFLLGLFSLGLGDLVRWGLLASRLGDIDVFGRLYESLLSVVLGVGEVREHGHVQEREHQKHRQQD